MALYSSDLNQHPGAWDGKAQYLIVFSGKPSYEVVSPDPPVLGKEVAPGVWSGEIGMLIRKVRCASNFLLDLSLIILIGGND